MLPGDLAGSPALTFSPLPVSGPSRRRTLHREMERRYEAYKSQVVKPFFRDHFARIDRQVVLVDALGAIHKGPQAVEDMRRAMADILSAFRPGRNAWLSQLLLGKRVERILFAATKADHLHHTQHPRLTAIMEALTREARDRANFAGSETAALSLASLRATTEELRNHNGSELPCVRGTLMGSGKQAAFYIPESCRTTRRICWARQETVRTRGWMTITDLCLCTGQTNSASRRRTAAYPAGPCRAISDRRPAVTVFLRPARSTDAGATGTILHDFSRENDWMPELHSCAETIAFCGRMIDQGWVTVAETQAGVVGFLALDGTEIHSLYLAAPSRGQGVGQELLEFAKSGQNELSLYAFQANEQACRFYERNGFAEIARSDGSRNDENLPDIRYIWRNKGLRDG